MTTTRVSIASDGTRGNNYSYDPSISSDGRYVAFYSLANNLVVGDTNGASDIFVRDRNTGTTSRVSVASNGTEGNYSSYNPSISSDGRYVAFYSLANNLVAGDTNQFGDIFVHDRNTGTTRLVSLASNGTQGNDLSYNPTISSDGRYVAFTSSASNLVTGDTNGFSDIFVHDQSTGTTSRVSVASNGTEGNDYSDSPSISSDGRYVAFTSAANNLVTGDTNSNDDIFVHDRNTGTTSRVSVGINGTQGNDYSGQSSISSDGRYVAFTSAANNLVSGDTNNSVDIFVHDRNTGTTSRVSMGINGTQGNSHSYNPSISSDGRYVAFRSEASNLVAGDTNGFSDIFVHDRNTGTTSRVSMGINGTQGNDSSDEPSISGGGQYVVFKSSANNLVAGDTYNSFDIFVADWINNNNPPTNIRLSKNTVLENRARNTTVGLLTTTDPDAGQTHSYSLVSGEGDTNNSAFNILNNRLRTNEIFDYETNNSYSIRVRTTDNAGGTFEKIFTIDVTDLAENNPATDILLSKNNIPENRGINSFVGNFTAVDPDGIQNHTYSLVSGVGSTDNSAFNILNNRLRSSQRFDFETKNTYSIRVRTTDSAGDTFEKVFGINITDVAEPSILITEGGF